MAFKIEKRHIFGFVLGIAIIAVDFLVFMETQWFIPLIVIALTIGWSQFWVDFFVNQRKQKELETMFPEFVRNLVGAIKSGMPVGKAIMHVSQTDYGALTPHIVKLSNQIEWAIPTHKALMNFSNETGNAVIKRAIATVIEAEQSGGNIEDVLETVTQSVIEIKKIKMARKSSIHSQLVQSYIIFMVFLGVMIVIQNLLIPYIAQIEQQNIEGVADTGAGSLGGGAMGGAMEDVEFQFDSMNNFFFSLGAYLTSIRGVFLMLACIQACFAGLVLGKLAEGDIKMGLKHSLILMTLAFFVISLAQGAMA